MPLVGHIGKLVYRVLPARDKLDSFVLPTLDLKVIWRVVLHLRSEYFFC